MLPFKKHFKILFALYFVCLGACTLGEKPRPFMKGNLFIVNGLSEDFSLIKREGESFHIQNDVSMSPTEESIHCMAPSQSIAYESNIYVVCSRSHSIQIYDSEKLELKRVIQLPANSNPMNLLILNSDKAYVTSFVHDKIYVINPTTEKISDPTKRLLAEIDFSTETLAWDDQNNPGAPRPGQLVYGNDFVYVALSNLDFLGITAGPGYVAKVDPNTNQVVKLIQTSGRNTIGLYHQDNRGLFILNGGTMDLDKGGFIGDGKVDFLDYSTGDLKTLQVGGSPQSMVIDEVGHAYLSNAKEGKLLRFDTIQMETLPSIDLRSNACNNFHSPEMTYISALTLDARYLYLTEFNSDCFMVLDLETLEIKEALKTGDGPTVIGLWN